MWTAVSVALPKQGEIVLAAVGGGKKRPQRVAVLRACHPEPGVHDDDEFGWLDEDCRDYVGPVTHWMPLPPLPHAE